MRYSGSLGETEPKQPDNDASAERAMLSSIIARIEGWKARESGDVKRKVGSGVEPFLGSRATDTILQPVSAAGTNLLPAVESKLAVFLGKRAAAALVSDIVDHAVFDRGAVRQGIPKRSFRDLVRRMPSGWARLMLLAAASFLGLGIAGFLVWLRTGDPGWLDVFFRSPGTFAALGLAAIELWFSLQVLRQFERGEPLRPAWFLISGSAVANLTGVSLAAPGRDAAMVLSGAVRFALLAAGLYQVLRVYRRFGFLTRLRAFDWALLTIPAAYAVYRIVNFELSARWAVDPLLACLLAEALLLFRSVRGMGQSWISRCWGSYSSGIFLTSVGNIGLWLAGPMLGSLTWYAWLPAAAAFAVAPAYQLEAIRYATVGERMLLRQP
jgi:hypothetical protein